MDEIDLLVICFEGLEPLQARDLIRWNIGRDERDNLPSIVEFKRHIYHPSMEWWIGANANKLARAMTAETAESKR